MSTDREAVFAALFAGRTDAYGTENGRCARMPFDPALLARRHLDGTELVGIYPMVHLDNGWHVDRKSTRLNSSHSQQSRMPSSA